MVGLPTIVSNGTVFKSFCNHQFFAICDQVRKRERADRLKRTGRVLVTSSVSSRRWQQRKINACDVLYTHCLFSLLKNIVIQTTSWKLPSLLQGAGRRHSPLSRLGYLCILVFSLIIYFPCFSLSLCMVPLLGDLPCKLYRRR